MLKNLKEYWCHIKFEIQSFNLHGVDWMRLYLKYLKDLNRINNK